MYPVNTESERFFDIDSELGSPSFEFDFRRDGFPMKECLGDARSVFTATVFLALV